MVSMPMTEGARTVPGSLSGGVFLTLSKTICLLLSFETSTRIRSVAAMKSLWQQ